MDWYGGFQLVIFWYPIVGMVFGKIINLKWMTGGTPILGKPLVCLVVTLAM